MGNFLEISITTDFEKAKANRPWSKTDSFLVQSNTIKEYELPYKVGGISEMFCFVSNTFRWIKFELIVLDPNDVIVETLLLREGFLDKLSTQFDPPRTFSVPITYKIRLRCTIFTNTRIRIALGVAGFGIF